MLIAVGWSLILWLIVNSCIRYPPRTDEPENLRPQKCWLNCPSHLSHLSDQRALIGCCCSVHRPKSDPLWPTKAVSPVYCWQDTNSARQYLVNSSFLGDRRKRGSRRLPPLFLLFPGTELFFRGRTSRIRKAKLALSGRTEPEQKITREFGSHESTVFGTEKLYCQKVPSSTCGLQEQGKHELTSILA